MYDNLAFLRPEETPFPDEENFGPLRTETVRRLRLVDPWRHAVSRGVWAGFETGLDPAKYVRRTRDSLDGFSDTLCRGTTSRAFGKMSTSLRIARLSRCGCRKLIFLISGPQVFREAGAARERGRVSRIRAARKRRVRAPRGPSITLRLLRCF